MRPSLLLAILVAVSGCALTSKADLVGTRYFTPETAKVHLDAASSTGPEREAPTIRLGRVSSGAHVRERIAYREAAHEIAYYEDQQWTERPEVFVRRALSRTLFEGHAFRRAVGGSIPTLDVELIAFDELRLPTGRVARVEVAVVLYEDRAVLFEDTIVVDRPVNAVSRDSKGQIEDVVAAMGQALDAATEQIGKRIGEELATRAPRKAQ